MLASFAVKLFRPTSFVKTSRIGSIRIYNGATYVFDILDNVKQKFISDSTFNGLPVKEQKQLVFKNIKKELLDETECIYESDGKVRRVHLKEYVLHDPIILSEHNIMPPQSWLDAGVYNFGEKKAALAAECCWFAACRQLKYYLRQFDIDVNSHGANSEVIQFLFDTCTDKTFANSLDLYWTTLESEAHVGAHKDESKLRRVIRYLKVAEEFCNTLYEISQLDFFNKDELLKNLDPHFMSQVLMPDPTEKDIKSEVFDWKSITEWVILGKLTKEEVEQKWIMEGKMTNKKFDKWMNKKCEVFLEKKEKQSKKLISRI
ncbi:hypothetical protein ACQ4LE_010381 [Meloidogyne hapla]|uniref:Uncharacterized protein n=1 Tax=Meloidogyne hapla TaxID=6305 RepID=A0A1I8C3M5_MELHA